MSWIIATVFGIGHLRPASGTWGSAAAVLMGYGLHELGGFPLLALASVLLFPLGWWATASLTRGQDDHDPSEVVVDEVVGQWIALWVVSYGAWHAGVPALAMYPGWIAAFLLFRLFDIWKPNLVGRADRRNDAFGVMLDDVIAGIYAALATGALAFLYHVVLA